jgi:phosphonate transport system substrate-binding protein
MAPESVRSEPIKHCTKLAEPDATWVCRPQQILRSSPLLPVAIAPPPHVPPIHTGFFMSRSSRNSSAHSPRTSASRSALTLGAIACMAAALVGSLSGTTAASAAAAGKAKAKPAVAKPKPAPAPAATATPDPAVPASTTPAKPTRTLRLGAIPDVTPERLVEINGTVANYLAKKLNVKVEYVPVADYPSAVSLFRTGDLDLVWFGGLTGVQARLQTPGAKVLAQRDVDDDFHSVFIVNTSVQALPAIDSVGRLAALKGFRFTFGSESSTSGRTMPEYFLDAAGLDSSRDFAGAPGYSGGHDKTIDLVQAGTYEAGALNEQVWARRVAAGTVDLNKVKLVFRTPGYKDYHWIAGPKTDERFGAGFSDRIKDAFLTADADVDGAKALSLLGSKKFIPTNANNYKEIEKIGRTLGLIR